MKQIDDTTVEVKLSAPWSAIGNEVVSQIGDLLGVRLVVSDAAQLSGTWPELKANMPKHMLGMEAQLEDGTAVPCRLGLLWAVEDHGAPIDWVDQADIRMEIGQAVIAGVVNSLSAAAGQKLTLIPVTGPVEVADQETWAFGADEPRIMLTWQAAGDDVIFTFSLLVPESAMRHLADPPAADESQQNGTGSTEPDRENHKVPTRAPHLPQLQKSRDVRQRGLGIIMDLPLKLTVEIGNARMLIKDVLALGKGSVVELDKIAGDLVDIRVNDKLLARGEVVVLPDGKFGVRVMEIINSKERLQNLQVAK